MPAGYTLPEKRMKPWGTAHAVYAAREQLDAPFCVINADDFYGAEAFRLAAKHLQAVSDDDDFAMVGYLLKNTLSDTGHVSRGICSVSDEGVLKVHHRAHAYYLHGGRPADDRGRKHTYTRLSAHAVVSMNMWGFPAGYGALP